MAAEELRLHFFPAADGDAILLDDGTTRVIVDMGRPERGIPMLDALAGLNISRVRLLMVSHIDADHIGGVLNALETDRLEVDEIWFNGRDNLDGKATPTAIAHGPVMGNDLTHWIITRSVRWNGTDGLPVITGFRTDDDAFGAMKFTVLGPSQDQLGALRKDWPRLVEHARDDEPPEEVDEEGLAAREHRYLPRELTDMTKLENCATTHLGTETLANKASIRVLLEWKGLRILLTGDGHTKHIAQELKGLVHNGRSDLADGAPLNGVPRVRLDLVKVPHHGSRDNMTQPFANLIDCPRWVFSTNGTRSHHPNPESIARILLPARPAPPTLYFNEQTKFSLPWAKPELKERFSYATCFAERGKPLVITLAPRKP